MLPARQLFHALEAIIASHSFPTLQFLELAHQQAWSTESACRGNKNRRLHGLVGANRDD
jgi:hypothetical protein